MVDFPSAANNAAVVPQGEQVVAALK